MQVKTAAAQHRSATERQSDRLRERVAQISMSNMKALLPDIRISSAAFVTQDCVPEKRRALSDQQLVELEKRHVALMESSQAMKQLAVDALHAMALAEHRLHGAVDATSVPEPPPASQRDLFPALRPLTTTDTAQTHPALRSLQSASDALEDRVEQAARYMKRHTSRKSSLASLLGEARQSLGESTGSENAMRMSELGAAKENRRPRAQRSANSSLSESSAKRRRADASDV